MTKTLLGRIKKLTAIALAAATLTLTAVPAFANTARIMPVSIEMACMGKVDARSHNFTVKSMNRTGTIGSDVNVRTKPWVDDGSHVINALGAGQRVHVTGRVYKNNAPADWYRINFQGRVAYISKSLSYITFDNKPDPTPVKKVMTVTGVTNYLGLRSMPTTDDRYEIDRLYNGDKVTVLDHSNHTFYLVRVQATGRKGYVVARFLK